LDEQTVNTTALFGDTACLLSEHCALTVSIKKKPSITRSLNGRSKDESSDTARKK